MDSMIEIRKYAISKAVDMLGRGTASKDVISKAKEIEAYIVGDAVLPEVYNEMDAASGLMGQMFNAVSVAK